MSSKHFPPRAGVAVAAGALALLAVRFAPHTPRFTAPLATRAPGATPAPSAAIDTSFRRQFTLASGETLSRVLARAGVADSDAARIVAAAALPERAVPAGLGVTVERSPVDSLPSEVVLAVNEDRRTHVRRTERGWVAEDERVPWTTDTLVISGVITSSLYNALDAANAPGVPLAARHKLAWALADIFEYRVDMSRELQPGDAVEVLVERSRSPGGAVRMGDVLAARLNLSGTPLEAIRFGAPTNGRAEYFDGEGKSLRLAFLRAPLEFRRISSVFGMRKHPILGIWRQHKGTDYAANAGTPVRAIGDATVIFAGHKGGYGNVLELRHRNGMVSRYGHLRGFAHGVRGGAHVGIGQTVAYVGMTGLATAPHLHFEVLVNGVQRDPRVALRSTAGFPVAPTQRATFDSQRTFFLAALAKQPGDTLRAVAMR